MKFLLIFITLGVTLIIFWKFIFKKSKNKKIKKYKNKLLSKESNIEKIFLRDDEKTFSNPNINIHIGFYENQENINRKSNIHRARLSKFKKSKLNGEIIYIDEQQKVYKYLDGKRLYL